MIIILILVILLTSCVSFENNQPDLTLGVNGIIIPLYIYPSDKEVYIKVIKFSNKNPQIPVIVILNPSNGPGEIKDTIYSEIINKLKSNNITVIGYVSTKYANRDKKLVKKAILTWKKYYPEISGIFIDEMTWERNKHYINYYKELNLYIKSLGIKTTVSNPGRPFSNNYFKESCADIIIGWEEAYYPSTSEYQTFNHDKLGILVHSQRTFNMKQTKIISKKYRWIYITQDRLNNPWDRLTSYLDDISNVINQPY